MHFLFSILKILKHWIGIKNHSFKTKIEYNYFFNWSQFLIEIKRFNSALSLFTGKVAWLLSGECPRCAYNDSFVINWKSCCYNFIFFLTQPFPKRESERKFNQLPYFKLWRIMEVTAVLYNSVASTGSATAMIFRNVN